MTNNGSKKKPLCIYHANCLDGFASAWIIRRVLGEENVDFHPGVYQEPPPNVGDRTTVYLVDFSYKKDVVISLMTQGAMIVHIDHHKTALEDLASLPVDFPEKFFPFWELNSSGAGLTWKYFYPPQVPPHPLIKYIEDRDLWRFQYPESRAINAALFSYPYDFEVWDRIFKQTSIHDLETEGLAIERKHHKDIAELLKVTTREIKLGNWIVAAASLPYTYSSDAGHSLASGHPSKIGACYWDTPQGRVFSLRSTEDGPDVSEIAKSFGGGGHKHAAGFKVPILQAIDQFEILSMKTGVTA